MNSRWRKAGVISCVTFVLCLPCAARAEIVVVVHPQSAISRLSKEQVAAYFLGKSTDLRPVEQTEGSVLRGEFYRRVLDRDASQVRAVWAKLIFTGTGRVPRERKSSTEVKNAVAGETNAIGYIYAEEVDPSVKIVFEIP